MLNRVLMVLKLMVDMKLTILVTLFLLKTLLTD
nr:MAG TPA: hypothetical protein [Crassvirales sp.]DAK71198.1 MAG TPA: hypothetical protein [Caudoviricetes sp.]DAP79185.1 MAG TPA: hypothetical protein [Caudoviricetes sp.]